MDRFFQRKNSSFENPSSSSLAATLTSSDFDFGDVFGGPPRRSSSIHSSDGSVNSGDIDFSPSRRSGSIGKAVFGDQSVNRDDFFDDIFRGYESCRSRKMSDCDQLCSDHFGTPITIAQFSLGNKLNKSMDLLPARFSSQSVKISGRSSKTGTRPSFHKSRLSQEFSLLSKSARTESGRNFKEDPKSPEASINSNPFHFSVNNWSCRRVPLVMPLRGRNGLKLKERIEFEKCSSSNGRMENDTEENVSKNMKNLDKEKNCSNKPEVNGKIQECVKISNPEASLKRIIDVKGQSQSCRFSSPNTNSVDIKTGDDSFMVDRNVEEPLFDSTMDDPFQVEFLIEELPNGEDGFLKTDDHHEAIQVSDAKIQMWSNGKQGNIRSLLSTLQYVLWAESGWKPVALVDIIEGSAVKRAYQKALLCLHPDKLQQKGAASHKRYIAQVVFDTLQDAWDHFNLIGQL